jgi:hypothetical protein
MGKNAVESALRPFALALKLFDIPSVGRTCMNNFTRSERISLKLHPTLNEKWVQGLIAVDPGILGLGDLVLRDKERIGSE